MFKNTTSQTKQTMDNISETIPLIHHGCNLARDLESNLPNLANQPENLFSISKSLDEIMRVFGEARERLHSSSAAHHDLLNSYVQIAQRQQIDASLQEWLRCNYTPAMEDHYIQTQRLIAEKSSSATPSDMRDSGGQAMDHIITMVSHDMNASSSSQSRPRRRYLLYIKTKLISQFILIMYVMFGFLKFGTSLVKCEEEFRKVIGKV